MITITKLTDVSLLRTACTATTGKPSKMSLDKAYTCEHSPIRTQLFWIEMKDIPTFVSVHFVRHKIGVEHFVRSNRVDRAEYTAVPDRLTPVTHCMLINAEALITMSRKRLCMQASKETREVMHMIKQQMLHIDPALYSHMVPNCVYRGKCHELKSCGGY